jgi:ParB/RepB/Spo0J family partition protein
MDDLRHLPITSLREPKVKLREVNRESLEYLEMRDSIREHGILQPLLVRPQANSDDAWEIIEGLHRYTGAKDIGLQTLPCLIREATDDEVLVLQLVANAISPETKLAEYAHQLKRLMQRDPDLTQAGVACLIRKSPAWVGKCLGLMDLLKAVQVMVNRGEICLDNAYMLAKIPKSMQLDYVDQAKLMPPKQFKPIAAVCIKRFKEAVKQGKMDAFYSDKFQAVAHLRSLKEIEQEAEKVGALVCTGEGCKTVLDGFNAALRWVRHLDRQSVREQEDAIRIQRERKVLDVHVDD